MNNYRKGTNVEEPLERNRIPIPELPENFLWMQVILKYVLVDVLIITSLLDKVFRLGEEVK